MEHANMLHEALKYLDKELSVIPLWSPAEVKKHPQQYQDKLSEELEKNSESEDPVDEEELEKEIYIKYCKSPITSWKEYQTRLPSKEEVTRWFTEYPDANIGIITGRVSNLVVFDLDSAEALKYSQERGGFPATVKATSGKGEHHYMKHPGFETRNNVNRKLTIDIRGDGGYIVAPPSIHGSGNQYTWITGSSMFDIEPAECNEWMIDYLKSLQDKKQQKKETPNTESHTAETKTSSNRYCDILRDGCKVGERNDTATRLIGHLFKKGLDEQEIWQIVKLWNTKNTPPLSESELKSAFNAIRNSETRKKNTTVDITSFLSSFDSIKTDYTENKVIIPFGGSNLSGVEQMLNGGLFGGRFYVLGGIPSAGKTALLNCIADNICLNGYPVLFFSYDDGITELRNRTFARFSNHSIEEFNKGTLSENDFNALRENESIKQILGLKYTIDKEIRIEDWDDWIDRVRERHDKPPVIMIDYLRKLKSKKHYDSRDERLRIDNILDRLTDLANKHNIPIVTISELARDSYKEEQHLNMASFKETGKIEYAASWLGILAVVDQKDDGYKLKKNWESLIQEDGSRDLIVLKAKRGTGSTGIVPLNLCKEKMIVSDRSNSIGSTFKLVKKSKKIAA